MSREESDAKRTRFSEAPAPVVVRKLKIKKKVYPSVAQFPTVDFKALLETEREKIERDSNAVISMRGKGSGFEQDDVGNDLLHVLIEAESEDQAHKAERMVRDVINDPSKLPAPVQTQLAIRQSIFGPRTGTGQRDNNTGGGHAGRQEGCYKEISVPEDVAGGIIGRAGETVKRLQMESGTRIQINREPSQYEDDGKRSIIIRGPTQESVDHCERLVMEFVASRGANNTNNTNNYQQRPRDFDPNRVIASAPPSSSVPGQSTSPSPPPYQQQQQQHQQIVEHHSVPNYRAGAIIGRGGATIKALQSKYRARVTVPSMADPVNPSMRTIVIMADTPQIIEQIKREIDDIVEGKAGFVGGPQDIGTPVRIPDDKAGLIIGKQGSTIKSIQDRFKVRIQIPAAADEGSMPATRTATVIGRPDMVAMAVQEIEAIVSGELYTSALPTSAPGQTSMMMMMSAAQSAESDYSQQWEEYYKQLRQLPPDQQKAALEALAEHQKSIGHQG